MRGWTMLTELAPAPATALPLAALRDHLRLGTGFADDAVQDPVLEAAARAALAAVEARTGRRLLSRGFALRAGAWRGGTLALPGDATALVAFEIEDADGLRVDALDRVRLVLADGRATVAPRGAGLPRIPRGGAAVLGLTAGMGPWEALPGDLRQAVLMLAASYYEDRGARSEEAFPAVVAGLLAPWRMLRIGGRA